MTDEVVRVSFDDREDRGSSIYIGVPKEHSVSLHTNVSGSADMYLHDLTRKDVEAIYTALGEFLIETS